MENNEKAPDERRIAELASRVATHCRKIEELADVHVRHAEHLAELEELPAGMVPVDAVARRLDLVENILRNCRELMGGRL